jgi:hypothetical protein
VGDGGVVRGEALLDAIKGIGAVGDAVGERDEERAERGRALQQRRGAVPTGAVRAAAVAPLNWRAETVKGEAVAEATAGGRASTPSSSSGSISAAGAASDICGREWRRLWQ